MIPDSDLVDTDVTSLCASATDSGQRLKRQRPFDAWGLERRLPFDLGVGRLRFRKNPIVSGLDGRSRVVCLLRCDIVHVSDAADIDGRLLYL